MKYVIAAAVIAAALLLAACAKGRTPSGLSRRPQATFVQIECYDRNGDRVIDAADAADPSQLPDLNADGARDDADAAFFRGVSIPLDPAKQDSACQGKNKDWGPEYLVAHNSSPATVDCAQGPAVLLLGVGGGVANLKTNAAEGVRSIVDGLQQALADRGVQTISVISGESVVAATNVHSSMEDWLTNATRVYLDRYPCLRVAIVGHSHGAVSAEVVSSRLEGAYGPRFIEVVNVDRSTVLYLGDTQSWPSSVRVLNIYETTDSTLPGAPRDGANIENWDASGEKAPENGDKGGAIKPVNHTTIDNSDAVKQRIIADVLKRM